MLKEILTRYLPPHWQGVAVDLVFALLGLFLLPLVGWRIEGYFDRSLAGADRPFLIVSLLIILVFFWRFAALFIKRVPVQSRLTGEAGCRSLLALWILNLFAVILSTAFVIVAVSESLKAAGLEDFGGSNLLIIAAGIFFPVAEIFLLARLIRPPEADERMAGKTRISGTELFADLGLFAYIFVWQAFYNTYLAAIMPNALGSFAAFIFILVVSAIVFVMFYLGPRSPFLIEDAGYPATWISIALVFLTSFTAHLAWQML